mgnify:FL=1
MNILIFLAVILVTIVLAIFINRLVRCPLLVGFIFFSIALLVAIILSNLTLVILAIILGIVAFVSAFLDCLFKSCCFFRNNSCLRCHNPYQENNNNNENVNNSLRIINGNGEVVASISGNSVNCYDEESDCCCNNGRNGANTLLSDTNTANSINSNITSYSCNSRGYRRRF